MYSVKICCDWFNKDTDWPIAGQNKLSWENQTKDTRRKKGGVSRVQRDAGRWTFVLKEGAARWQRVDKNYRLI